MVARGLLAGIDLGTSSVKVGLFSPTGDVAALVSEPLAGDRSSPDAWWDATCRGLQRALADLSSGVVCAVSAGGQSPTLVGVDRLGKAVGSAILWSDTRAAPHAEDATQLLGRPIGVGVSYLPLALYIRDEEPSWFARIHRFLQAWDVITYRLTGNLLGSEVTGLDPWPRADLQKLGLPPEKFAEIRPWGSVLGRVTSDASEKSGLPVGIPVIGGSGDLTLSLIGTPGLETGVALNQGGTSGGIALLWDEPLQGDGILCGEAILPGLWFAGGPTSASGLALEWILRDVLSWAGDYATCLERAFGAPPCDAPLLFLPYLKGQRTPVWDEQARGVFFGLSSDHSGDHLVTAVVEGITLAEADILYRVKAAGGTVRAVTVSGGQANSRRWNQLKADAFGVPVQVPQVTATGCLGAAAVAGWGVSLWPDALTGGRAMSKVDHRLLPRPGATVAWGKRLAVFRDLYRRTRDLFPQLRGLYSVPLPRHD